jgi:Na+/H+ antiporter NhaD/arsenite permease-like protein
MNWTAEMNFWITLGIVLLTYIGIALGHWPIVKSNRATIVLVGVGLLLVFKQIEFTKLSTYLDFNTLILLFSMMVINANLKLAGFFNLTGDALIRTTRSPRVFLAIEILIVGVLSALFLNDTICIMFTPFILTLTDAVKRNPIPYLIALATASNVGSTATLTGNPQNMIIGTASGISYLQFAGALLPIAILGLGVIWVVLVLLYPGEFKSNPFQPAEIPQTEINRPMLIKALIVMAAMLAAFLIGVPTALAAFLAACVLLITRRTAPHLVFAEFDWGLLVFFSGLFIVSGALETGGVTPRLFSLIDVKKIAGVWPLSGVTVVLSNLVSNVPAVLLMKPVIGAMSRPEAGWLTLAMSSTLAGNLTLLGSVANLIVAESASRWRVDLGFWEYTRAGILITILTLLIGICWLQAFVW